TITATIGTTTLGPDAVTFVPGPLAKLGFIVPPSDVVAGGSFSPAVGVAAEDSYGNVVPAASGSVSLMFGTNPGAAMLGGYFPRPLVAGMTTFPGLHVDIPAMGYTLVAHTNGLADVTSLAFDVLPGSPDMMHSTVIA